MFLFTERSVAKREFFIFSSVTFILVGEVGGGWGGKALKFVSTL